MSASTTAADSTARRPGDAAMPGASAVTAEGHRSGRRYEIVIGLETHAQLSTRAKIFSGASTQFGAAPNTHASAVDIALPGVLPVLNRGAVERALRFGLAVGGTINRRSVFARKNYFYPDLPKGYQISQYEIPVVQGGGITVVTEAGTRWVRLTRAHLEEDAGKSLHEDFHGMTGIDLNRAGTPLLEIVSEPDMRSAQEAVAYARALHTLVTWIGICDGNMQEGSFRCDANVSVRPVGEEQLGTRCEIKNLNSFRFLQHAIEFEVRRQVELIEDGGRVVQETRLYDPDRGETRTMRSKEDAQDYRYFPDPDLPPLVIAEEWIERARSDLPELPDAMRERLISQHGLAAYEAATLTSSRPFALYFEDTARAFKGPAKSVANWVLGEVSAALNARKMDIGDAPVRPAALAELLNRIQDGTLNQSRARRLFEELWTRHLSHTSDTMHVRAHVNDADLVMGLIDELGLRQLSDAGAIEALVDQAIAANAPIVAEFRAGKEKAFNALVGKVMAASKGKANPAQVNAILRARLG
jgi:aspartyl-tRNA(Asn)/glutamyl-tRNA(Gln) amidotransferase subunit B